MLIVHQTEEKMKLKIFDGPLFLMIRQILVE